MLSFFLFLNHLHSLNVAFAVLSVGLSPTTNDVWLVIKVGDKNLFQ